MKFRPIHDASWLRASTPTNKTAGGIIIPDTAKRSLPRER